MHKSVSSVLSLLATLLVATFLTSCGGKDSHEKLMADSFDLMDKVVEIIGEVKDKESGEAAAKKVEKLEGKFDKLAERAEALGTPEPEEMKALDKKFEKRREELGKKMMTAMMQAGTSGSEALAEAMKNIGSSMGKLR